MSRFLCERSAALTAANQANKQTSGARTPITSHLSFHFSRRSFFSFLLLLRAIPPSSYTSVQIDFLFTGKIMAEATGTPVSEG